MPGCAAIGCSNSAKKGFLMKKFPKDPARRKTWVAKMKRDKWTPTDFSCLCEVHFPPEMWETTREDGTRKLRLNAVPTIFCFTEEKTKRKPPVERKIQKEISCEEESISQPSTSRFDLPEHEISPIVVDNVEHILEDNSSIDVNEKLLKYEKYYRQERARSAKYKRLFRNSQAKFKKEEKKEGIYQQILQKLLNIDQINVLSRQVRNKKTKFMKWSNKTTVRAFKLKFSCGTAGYEELIKQGYPLPSVRTLQRRLQNMKFDSGILEEVFDFLKLKVENFTEEQKDCCLILDEMAIKPGLTFDSSLNKYFGDVTLPQQYAENATHVLVFLLAGMTQRWKQVVAYYFTGDSIKGEILKEIIHSIFEKSENLKLNILSITSDMGPSNQSLWRIWGITAGRYSSIRCKIDKPSNPKESAYIFADVPHLFKNIKSMLVTNKVILIPKDLQEKHHLPTNEVLFTHLEDLVKHQENHNFKLAPKLNEEDLMPSHFDKMKVKKSTNIINHSVSSALKYLSEELNKPGFKTTAWFIDQVEKWFYLMTSRHPSAAISKMNIEVYRDAMDFLRAFRDLFQRMEVGYKKIWKPSQTGVLISTTSLLELHEVLLQRGYEFILTSRFSQDCLENLFCTLRTKQVVPNAVQVKNNLKLICVSQYLKNPHTSSYDEDDREFLAGFLDVLEEKKEIQPEETPTINIPEKSNFNLCYSELNSLYNIAGYIVNSIMKTCQTCEICLEQVGSRRPVHYSYAKLVNLKRFRENTLFFCSEISFHFFIDMESVISRYLPYLAHHQNVDCKTFLKQKISEFDFSLPDCHNLKTKIINRYVAFRLKIYYKKAKHLAKKFASKSVTHHV